MVIGASTAVSSMLTGNGATDLASIKLFLFCIASNDPAAVHVLSV